MRQLLEPGLGRTSVLCLAVFLACSACRKQPASIGDPYEHALEEIALKTDVALSSEYETIIRAQYINDQAIRKELARSFFAYCETEFGKGVLSSDAPPNSSVGLLYTLERKRNPRALESPSLLTMLDYIEAHAEWFMLDSEMHDVALKARNKHAAYIRYATATVRAGDEPETGAVGATALKKQESGR